MKRLYPVVTILCLGCFLPTIALAFYPQHERPLWMELSIPAWAEAEMKEGWARGPFSPLADSSHSYDVLFYELDLTFPMIAHYLEGTALIRCRSEVNNLNAILLHLVDLVADSVKVDGNPPYSWTQTGGGVTVIFATPFAQYDTFQVLIGYGGSPSSGYYTTGSGELRTVFTLTEPSDSRHWFPCWDEPWDKADEGCAINAQVPLGFVVASNGLLVGVDTTSYLSDTTVTYHWVESYPISTYLMSVAIAPYKQILDSYVTGTGDTLEVRHFVYGPDSSVAAANFAETSDMMAFFAGIFGEYPFEKYGMACVTSLSGGMEHQTMTTILRGAALVGWEDGIAHELAHQWWGDLVTCFNWPEIWLNEGFATYSEALWLEHKYGFDSLVTIMTNFAGDYLSGPYTHYALYDPPELFSWDLVYTKGAWVLHMLRHMVGDSNYSAILHAYGEKFAYGNATTEDFRGVVDSVMNDSFDSYFQQWIYEPEHPQYEYGWQVQELEGNDYLLMLQVWQIQQHGPLFSMPVDMKLGYTGGDTTFSVWVEAIEFQEITVPFTFSGLSSGNNSFDLTFDPDNWLLDEHQEVSYLIVDVISTSPGQNELNALTTTNISVTFITEMDEETINDSTIVVNAQSTGRRQGTISYNDQTKTAIFDPFDDFAVGETVTMVVTADLRSDEGLPLNGSYEWSFTTEVSGDSPGSFVADSVYPVGSEPMSITAGDFDGDGDLDVATANGFSGDVSLLMNAGEGILASDSTYQVGNEPVSIFAADLNGDGKLDLATANRGSDDVSILLNNGDGTFAPHLTYPAGDLPRSVFVADLDGDSDLDLATAHEGSNDIAILSNNGHGTFATDSTYSVGSHPLSIFAGDLDGDGDPDLTTANYGSDDVSILENNGDGTFILLPPSPVGDGPTYALAADLDGDGDLDMTTTNENSHDVSVLLNHGDATFEPDSVYRVGQWPQAASPADLDGDGDLDLTIANLANNNFWGLKNNGDGSFKLQLVYSISDTSHSICAADIDGDGDLDLITANCIRCNPGNITILLNDEGLGADQFHAAGVPRRYSLYHNYPNPFNQVTEIRYDVPEACQVVLEIYNLLGQRVTTLVHRRQEAGYKKVRWDCRGHGGQEVASGIYVCRLKAGDFIDAKRMILLR